MLEPFITSRCILTILEFSYHPWCQGHSSPLSLTFVWSATCMYMPTFIMKAWEQKYHHWNKMKGSNNHESWSYQVHANSEIFCCKFGQQNGYELLPKIYTHVQNWKTYMWKFWKLKFGVHNMPLLEVIKVRSLTRWWVSLVLDLNAIFGMFALGRCPSC